MRLAHFEAVEHGERLAGLDGIAEIGGNLDDGTRGATWAMRSWLGRMVAVTVSCSLTSCSCSSSVLMPAAAISSAPSLSCSSSPCPSSCPPDFSASCPCLSAVLPAAALLAAPSCGD